MNDFLHYYLRGYRPHLIYSSSKDKRLGVIMDHEDPTTWRITIFV